MTDLNKIETLKQIIVGDTYASNPASISFQATVSMVTSKVAFQKIITSVNIVLNQENKRLVISLLSEEIDNKQFPSRVTVKPQDIEFIADEYIKIRGYNYLNNNIGNFLLLIAPM